MAIIVNFAVLNALLYAVRHFVEGTPNRWELITKFVSEQPKISGCPDVCLGNGTGKTVFINSKTNCEKVFRILRDVCPEVLKNADYSRILYTNTGRNPFKPVLLIPPIRVCCERNISMDIRCSFPLVYTMNGTFVGAMFHGRCLTCKTTYYYSYKCIGKERFYYSPQSDGQEFFQVTTHTVFSKDFLLDLDNSIWISGTTFEARAKLYTCNNRKRDAERLTHLSVYCRGDDWQLNPPRLMDAYFLWAIVNFYNKHCKLDSVDLTVNNGADSHHLDIEEMCRKLWISICNTPNKWIQHRCKTPGCEQGYVTVDGNEYLCRDMCAAPKEKVKISKDLPTIVRCCPKSPVTGGLHQKAAKFCPSHMKDEDAIGLTQLPELAHVKQSQIGAALPDNDSDTLLTGCKQSKNINRFFERTAGMLALIRPCGIVVSMTEMFSSESPTQVFIFLLRTFCGSVSDVKRLGYVGYDRTCDLVPFLRNQAKNKSAGAQVLLDNVTFLLDIFHANKHTEPQCYPPSNPQCLYHPKLDRFSAIQGVNTESCEQGFKRLNKYHGLTRKMTQYKRNVLFWIVNERFNEERELELCAKGLM